MRTTHTQTPQPAKSSAVPNDFAGPASDKLGAMSDSSAAPAVERRTAPRSSYRVVGTLETVGTGERHRDVRVMTRDADPGGVGFVAAGGELDDGQRAVLHVPGPDGRTRRIECRVRRSNALGHSPGWFEGSVEFVGEQPVFSEKRIRLQSKRERRQARA